MKILNPQIKIWFLAMKINWRMEQNHTHIILFYPKMLQTYNYYNQNRHGKEIKCYKPIKTYHLFD